MYMKKCNKAHYYIIKNFRGWKRRYNGQIVMISPARESSIYLYPSSIRSSYRYHTLTPRKHLMSMRVYFPDGNSIRVKRTCLKKLDPKQGEIKWAAMSL